MNNKFFRVAADVPANARKVLLSQFPPRFENVYCQSVTLAYRVTEEFQFDETPMMCVIYAIHRGPLHEAFLIRMGADTIRPDGQRFHLTLSTSRGVEPVEAGRSITKADTEQLELELAFRMRFQRFPLWKQTPTRNLVVA